jgi:hypothetical protein
MAYFPLDTLNIQLPWLHIEAVGVPAIIAGNRRRGVFPRSRFAADSLITARISLPTPTR